VPDAPFLYAKLDSNDDCPLIRIVLTSSSSPSRIIGVSSGSDALPVTMREKPTPPSLESPGADTVRNVARIERPEGVLSVLYSHSLAHMQMESSESVKTWDGIVLEQIAPYGDAAIANRVPEFFERDPQYGEIMRIAKELGRPIFLADAQTERTHYVGLFQRALRAAESVVAAAIITKLAWKVAASTKPVSRRDFLRFGGKGLLGLYLATPAIGNTMALVRGGATSEESAAAKVSYFLDDLNQNIHPETEAIIQTFRNHLIAQKMTTVMRELAKEGHGRPNVGLVIGSAHSGMEKALEASDHDRTEVIEMVLSLPGMEEERKSLAKIARYDFVDGQWQVSYIEDPALVALESH
jgi:hypothetical protein